MPHNGLMRALHVAAGNLYGGVERILVEIARARQSAWRHQFAVCFDARLALELREARGECHLLGDVRFSRPLTALRARRRLRQLCEAQRCDVIICHSPWTYALAAPATEARRVLWAHDALDGTHWTERTAKRLSPELVICNSQYTAGSVGNWLSNARREVIYAPVALDAVDVSSRAGVRRELGADDRTTVILIAARLERWKGHELLMDAAAQLRGDWMLWIAGGVQRACEAQLDRELKSLAHHRGLTHRIRFLGERRDVARLLRGADLYCQPNTKPEPFGLAFVEALAAGLPVVTVAAGGAREIVDETCGLLVPPGNRPALCQALQLLIDVPSRRHALGAAGPARARLLCDPATQIGRLEQALAPLYEPVPA